MDVLERIEKDKLVVFVNYGIMEEMDPKEDECLSIELLELAKIGKQMQEEIKKCNERGIISCFVRNCPGRNYCAKYKARSPKSLNDEGVYNYGDYETDCNSCTLRHQTVEECKRNCPLGKGKACDKFPGKPDVVVKDVDNHE